MKNITNPNLEKIPLAQIDDSGVFKYIQIRYMDKIFLRGRGDCQFHKGILRKFCSELTAAGLNKTSASAIGGGRIKHEPEKKEIFIYGYSNAYGRYDGQHEKSVEMLKQVYPDYKITCSNEGY